MDPPCLDSCAALPHLAVVLSAVDAAGLLILLAVEGAAVLPCQAAVVLGAHSALFAVDAALLALKPPGFPAGELAAFVAVRNAPLLIDFALVDIVVVLTGRGGGLRNQRNGSHRNGDGKKNGFHVHRLLLMRRTHCFAPHSEYNRHGRLSIVAASCGNTPACRLLRLCLPQISQPHLSNAGFPAKSRLWTRLPAETPVAQNLCASISGVVFVEALSKAQSVFLM
jgi:hypothetical protein